MHVHDVEGVVFIRQGMDVSRAEIDIGYPGFVGEVPCGWERVRGRFDPCYVASWENATGEVDCDAPWPAAYVQDFETWFEVWEEVRGGVGGCAPGVGF